MIVDDEVLRIGAELLRLELLELLRLAGIRLVLFNVEVRRAVGELFFVASNSEDVGFVGADRRTTVLVETALLSDDLELSKLFREPLFSTLLFRRD